MGEEGRGERDPVRGASPNTMLPHQPRSSSPAPHPHPPAPPRRSHLYLCKPQTGCGHGGARVPLFACFSCDFLRASCGHAGVLRASCGHLAGIAVPECHYLRAFRVVSCGHSAGILRASCGHPAGIGAPRRCNLQRGGAIFCGHPGGTWASCKRAGVRRASC